MKNKYKEALESMVYQFAYEGKKDGLPAYTTGGLSALEEAFFVLGWQDPQPCPKNKCALCNDWATCGTPTPSNYTKNYLRVCGKHFSQIQQERQKIFKNHNRS